MSGMITIGDERWSAAGWLYRFVTEDLAEVATSPQSIEVLTEATALGVLDLDDFPPADRPAVRDALGEPLVERFGRDLQPGYDPAPAEALLRELGAMAQRLR